MTNRRENGNVDDDELLRQFAQGRLDSEAEVRLALRIEESPQLQSRLAAISSDGFLDRVKNLAASSRVEAVTSTPGGMPGSSSDDIPVEGIPSELIDSPDYQILKELGRGGMGVVYAAKYLPMGRIEVLKVLNEEMVRKESAKNRFISEMRAIGQLNHPFIATAYQRVVLPTRLVFSMEYVPGIDLHQFIQKYSPVPVPVACTLAAQIATALQHAHTRKMVHRDIKPANVMVFEDDGQLQIKVLDFGLAKATSEQQAAGLTADGTMLGTPEYMAPEQALDAASADIRADIYSLGCTLHHLLVGRPPFTGTYQNILMAHAQREPDRISLERTDVPVELSEVVAKMMAKEPAQRYQTPNTARAALQPFTGSAKLISNPGENIPAVDTDLGLAAASQDTSVERPASESDESNWGQAKAEPDSPAAASGPESLRVEPRQDQREQTTNPNPATKRRQRIPRPFVFIATGLLIPLLLWATVLTFSNSKGTIVVEGVPEDAEVLIDGERIKLEVNGRKMSARSVVEEGMHRVEIVVDAIVVQGQTLHVRHGATEEVTFRSSPPQTPSEIATDRIRNPGIPIPPPSERLADYRLGGNWRIHGNELIHQGAGREHWLTFGDPAWTDYEFTYEVKFPSSYNGFSTLFRVKNDFELLQWGLGWLGNKAILEKQTKLETYGEFRPPKQFRGTSPGTWHKIRTVVSGDRLRCWIDDREVWDESNLPFSSGKVGVRVYSRLESHRVYFRNFLVVTLSGKKLLWRGLPTLPPKNFEDTRDDTGVLGGQTREPGIKIRKLEYQLLGGENASKPQNIPSTTDLSAFVRAGTTWRSDDGQQELLILNRNGDSFRGRFRAGPRIVREVWGIAKDSEIFWESNDVRGVRPVRVDADANRGADNIGRIVVDGTSPRLEFRWGSGRYSGEFTLNAAGVASIPHDAVRFKETDRYFRVIDGSMSWGEARDACTMMGGTLAKIDAPEKHAFVLDLATKADAGTAWLGGTDGLKEGEWRWLDGSPFTYRRWKVDPTEKDGSDKDCLGLIVQPKDNAKFKGQWLDLENRPAKATSAPNCFVCEWVVEQ